MTKSNKTKDTPNGKQTSLISQPEASQGLKSPSNGGNAGSKALIPEVVKNRVGSPRKFETPEQLEMAINNYFDECDNTVIKKKVVQRGEVVTIELPIPYTMAGLAVCLDIDRHTLLQNAYSKDKVFNAVVTRARRKIEESNLTHGMIGAHEARLSALNLASNFGYSDKSEVKHTLTPVQPLGLEKENKAGQ